jgi:predicted amidohydrolase
MRQFRNVKIACCQLAPQVGIDQIEKNRIQAANAIRIAASNGANVVVLPELTPSGYAFTDIEEVRELAEPSDGPTLQSWRDLSRDLGVVIVGGYCEKSATDHLYNSAAIVDPDGLRANYRKVHLWDNEKNLFSPGSDRPPVVDTLFGRLGVLICYDLEFPDWVRLPALDGAEILCAPTNWPLYPKPEGERPVEVVRVQALASLNRMFIAACGRSGPERGISWVGGSVIVDCDGFPLAGPLGEFDRETIYSTVNLGQAHNKWISETNHLFHDRRLELYHSML